MRNASQPNRSTGLDEGQGLHARYFGDFRFDDRGQKRKTPAQEHPASLERLHNESWCVAGLP